MAEVSETYVVVERNVRGGMDVVRTNRVVHVHKDKGSESGWIFPKIGHELDVAFHSGYLQTGWYSKCQECNGDHSAAIKEFIDVYRKSGDGAGIIRNSELEADAWRGAGVDLTAADLVARYQRGQISEVELLEGLQTAAMVEAQKDEAAIPALVTDEDSSDSSPESDLTAKRGPGRPRKVQFKPVMA